MANAVPADIDKAAFSGAPAPSGLSPDEKAAYERLQFVYQKGIGYGFQLGLRPQTMYALADSPVGLAAYFLDHDQRSYRMISRVFEGQAEGLTRDDVLDNVTLTWLTGTAVSTGRLYWENKAGSSASEASRFPVAVSVFPTSSIRCRGAGRSGRIPSSSTTTGSTAAATSPPGSSLRSSRKRSAWASGRCVAEQ
jgi:hypothetical protein